MTTQEYTHTKQQSRHPNGGKFKIHQRYRVPCKGNLDQRGGATNQYILIRAYTHIHAQGRGDEPAQHEYKHTYMNISVCNINTSTHTHGHKRTYETYI